MAKKSKNALTTGKKSQLPAEIRKRALKDAGKGVSTDQSDNIIPLVYILQAQSPQALKSNSAFIKGAEAGCLWLRNSADPLADGEEGFKFQPVAFNKCWIEWQPNRGGFVARHPERPKEAKEGKDKQNPKKTVWLMPNKNTVVESREFAGFVMDRGAPMPYVIPMGGSNHSAGKQWMTMMTTNVEEGVILPSWSKFYRVKTKFRQNDEGSWYMYDITPEEDVSDMEDYERGARLHTAFSSGAKQAADVDGGDI